MSVYLALHTASSPNLGEVAEFGRVALALGAAPDTALAVQRDANGALTVVLPIPEDARTEGGA
jgi:hypothetical protein